MFALTRASFALAEGDAAPSVEEIKAAEVDFNRGREAYRTGNHAEAAEYFEGADGHAPNDRVLELAIGARDKAGHADRAATLAQLGLELYPKSERLRKVATPLVDKAQAKLLRVTIECSEACNLLDGARLVHGAPALRRVVFLTPGDHQIRAAWSDDRAATKGVTGAAGESVELQFAAPAIPVKEVAPAPVAAPVAAPTEDRGQEKPPSGLPPLVFWIGAGTTAALIGVTAWSGIDTVNNPGADAVRKNCVDLGDSCPDYQTGRGKQVRTNVLIGVTGALGVATAVVGVFATNWSGKAEKKASEAKASVTPWVSYDYGPSMGAAGRF
jgi:hypothetical protein